MKVNFKLVHTESQEVIKTSHLLKEVIDHARKTVNDYRNYSVEEYTGNNLEDVCNLFYLVENFKDKMPLCISNIV